MYYSRGIFSIYYEKYGKSNKNIIILPGWGDTRKTFDYLINYFKDSYNIYIFDYPGFGNSTFPDNDLTIYDYADLFRNFIEDNSIDNPIIIAHSFGGRILTILAGYYELNINKSIMLDVSPIKQRKSIFLLLKQSLYKLLKKLSFLLPKKLKNKYLKKLISIFGSSDYKKLDLNMQQTFKNIINEDLSKYLENINNEVLIIWGDIDKETPLKYGKVINKKIKDSALIVIPNSGHFPYLDYPILINNIIKEFIK